MEVIIHTEVSLFSQDSYMGSPTHLLGDIRKPNKSVGSPKQDGYPESAVLEEVFVEHGVTGM